MNGNNNSTQVESWLGDFILRNAKSILTCIVFFCGLYIQYQASVIKMEKLEEEVIQVKVQLDAHYAKLDAMKLDKEVFEAAMKQFQDMSTDIRQIRDRLEDVLGDHTRHQPQVITSKNA